MANAELLRAISVRDINQVKQVLLSGHCSVTGDGWTSTELHPIVQCIKFGYWARDKRGCEILELLVRHGANTNIRFRGKTIIIFAAELDHLDCLQFLCDFGADLSSTTPDGDTALTIAAKKGNADCVKCLAEHVTKATINQKNNKGQTALMLATYHSHILCMEHLIAAGADLEVGDSQGFTALMLAIQVESTEAVELLLDKGAQINTVAEYGETPLCALVKEDKTRKFNSLQIILKALRLGLDPTLSRKDRTILHTKVAKEKKTLLRGLVMNGFPPLDLDCSELLRWCFNSRPSVSPEDILGEPSAPISPLALALLLASPNIAWYFIANNFFTRFDVEKLCWHKKIREFLQKEIDKASDDVNGIFTDYTNNLKQCLEILNYLRPNPHSLHTLSLVAISSALSQDFLYEPTTDLSNKESWTCKPTFRKRIERLEIPPSLKRELLHQTPLSGICRHFWEYIPHCGEVCFQTCHCADCECRDSDDDDEE